MGNSGIKYFFSQLSKNISMAEAIVGDMRSDVFLVSVLCVPTSRGLGERRL